MRTVLVTSFTPSLDSGRARRTYGIARALASLGPVDLVYGAFGADEPDPRVEAIEGLALHRVERPGTPRRAPAYLRARLAGVPDDFARGIWPGTLSRARTLTRGDGAIRLVADGPTSAAALLPLARRRTAIYSAHNLESSFRHRLSDATMSPRSLVRFERLLLERFAETWMVSPADMRGAAELAPAARIRLVPNVVDVAGIDPVPARDHERRVLFLADFGYEPNREALGFLLEQAMPALWRRESDVRLTVAGKGSAGMVDGADSRVEILGFVPDLGELYARAGCVVVPLLEGGGSPLKFVEALAYRVPVVATPTAAAGLDVVAGRHYLEAPPEPDQFATAILAALDPEQSMRLAETGRKLAESEYSIESLADRLDDAGELDR